MFYIANYRQVYNNVFIDPKKELSDGFLKLRDNTNNTQIYGNTFYGSGGNAIQMDKSYAKNVQIKNNIFYDITGYDIYKGYTPVNEVTIINNLYDNTPNIDGITDNNQIIGNPQFVNPGFDFHLQSTSPVIDRGLSLPEITRDYEHNPRPQGSGYDIGAYEYI